MPAAFLNPTTSRNAVTPSWYGPALSKNVKMGLPAVLLSPLNPSITLSGPIFPSPTSYQDAIISSLKMLFGTIAGERLWLPTYGLNLNALVFEMLNAATANTAQNLIIQAITTFEPRVSVIQVIVAPGSLQAGIANAIAASPVTNINEVQIQITLSLKGAPPNDVFTYSTTITPAA